MRNSEFPTTISRQAFLTKTEGFQRVVIAAELEEHLPNDELFPNGAVLWHLREPLWTQGQELQEVCFELYAPKAASLQGLLVALKYLLLPLGAIMKRSAFQLKIIRGAIPGQQQQRTPELIIRNDSNSIQDMAGYTGESIPYSVRSLQEWMRSSSDYFEVLEHDLKLRWDTFQDVGYREQSRNDRISARSMTAAALDTIMPLLSP